MRGKTARTEVWHPGRRIISTHSVVVVVVVVVD